MKASTVIAVATTFAATLVSAQLSSIPPCALSCAISSIGSSGCGQTDIACICKATAFINALTPCVEQACSASDLAKTIQAAEGLCSSAGVSLSIPTVAPTSAPATSAAATSAPTTAAVTTSSTTLVVSTTVSSVVTSPVVYSNTTTTKTGPTSSANVTVTTGKPSSIPTSASPTPTGAAGRNTVAMGGLGAILVFAAALL